MQVALSNSLSSSWSSLVSSSGPFRCPINLHQLTDWFILLKKDACKGLNFKRRMPLSAIEQIKVGKSKCFHWVLACQTPSGLPKTANESTGWSCGGRWTLWNSTAFQALKSTSNRFQIHRNITDQKIESILLIYLLSPMVRRESMRKNCVFYLRISTT